MVVGPQIFQVLVLKTSHCLRKCHVSQNKSSNSHHRLPVLSPCLTNAPPGLPRCSNRRGGGRHQERSVLTAASRLDLLETGVPCPPYRDIWLAQNWQQCPDAVPDSEFPPRGAPVPCFIPYAINGSLAGAPQDFMSAPVWSPKSNPIHGLRGRRRRHDATHAFRLP